MPAGLQVLFPALYMFFMRSTFQEPGSSSLSSSSNASSTTSRARSLMEMTAAEFTARLTALALVAVHPALVLVDHGHFQYVHTCCCCCWLAEERTLCLYDALFVYHLQVQQRVTRVHHILNRSTVPTAVCVRGCAVCALTVLQANEPISRPSVLLLPACAVYQGAFDQPRVCTA